ncbi:MAG TPA: transglutaminase-like domain-containing protein [Pyrinomonadaceae bacterium]|nr:transglutaminase-like domain-containing protein [Pyrinomonadaceae bacterium]
MTPAGKLLAAEARRRFAELVARPDGAIDLAHAALLVAAEERPGTDVDGYRAQLLELGLAARGRVAASPHDPVGALNRFVFEESHFHGNQEDYYDPRNSLLSCVIDERRGIPITLSVVYMELGRRAGLEVEGVGLPGHFVVRVRANVGGADVARLVDPFNRRVIDREDCQQLLDSLYGGQIALAEEHLRASAPREILARILRNLKGVYAQGRRFRCALSVVERILLVEPDAHAERRDRGALLGQLGRYNEAAAEMLAYLQAEQDAPDAALVQEQLKKLRLQAAALN